MKQSLKTLSIILVFLSSSLHAQQTTTVVRVVDGDTSNIYSAQVTLNWDPNTEDDIAGYKIYYGNSSGNYDSKVDVGNQASYTITALESGKTYYFAITAYDIYGSESGYSAEIVYNVPTVDTTSPSPPQSTIEEYKSQESKKGELQLIKTPYQNLELVWLSQGIDLTKHTIGPFTVKVRVEGIDRQKTLSIFPRIKYVIGTGNSNVYFDMKHEGDNVWRFDIPDPKWYKYRSDNLHYQVKIFDEEGDVITESRWQKELIDSFVQKDN